MAEGGLGMIDSAQMDMYAQLTQRATVGLEGLAGASNVFINISQNIDQSMYNVNQSFNNFNTSINTYESTITSIDSTMMNFVNTEASVIEQTGRAGDEVEKTAKKTEKAADQLKNILKIINSYGEKAFKFGADAFNMSNLQISAETQLNAVLAKTGAVKSAFDVLKNKASEIQMKTIYKDEVLLGGASKMVSGMTDPKAMESMMGTMADFAAGMSGGGALDTEAMAGYGAQLGAALGGDYASLENLGFNLTRQQKEMIENGSEMDKALAINEVVSQSWGGLAEAMANLPENRLVGIQNSIGEMKEVVGAHITPALLDLFAVIETNMPMIEGFMMGFGIVLGVVINFVTMLAEAASNVMTFIADNWSIFAPIIAGLGVALLVVIGYLAILTLQQTLFNVALWTCPITWIVGGIMLLVALIIGAVEAFNEFSGSSVSAVGMVGGVFGTLGALVLNILIYIWNGFVELVNFLANVFTDPITAVQVAFYNMCINVLGFIENLADGIGSLLSKVTGTEITLTAGISAIKGELEAKVGELKADSDYVEILQKKDFIDYTDAFTFAYEGTESFFGDLGDAINGGFNKDGYPVDPFIGGGGLPSGEAYGSAGNPATVKGTGNGGAVKVENEEDLDWMRQLAERDYIARIAQNTLAPNIRVEFSGPITKEADTDKIFSHLNEGLQEMLATAPEGVYV